MDRNIFNPRLLFLLKMPEEKKLLSKIFLIILLLMIVVGFSVPLFNIGSQPEATPSGTIEPRLCQSDKDCYLLCDDKPVTVLCSQNLCQQNECGEFNLFPYSETPITITLDITVNGNKIALEGRNNPDDIFVSLKDQRIQLFSSRLYLEHILEKLKISMTGPCLSVDQQQYCEDNNHNLTFFVNGQESLQGGFYIPQEGDEIRMVYS